MGISLVNLKDDRNETYRHLAPAGATVVGVAYKTSSTYDEKFCRSMMQKLADGKPLVEKTVKGHEIGSSVCGGGTEYALFFC